MYKQCFPVQVLGNNESRGSYDYALAHPREHMIAYYARYGSRAYAQMKIPPQYSITGLILLVSFLQYLSRKMSHEKVIMPACSCGCAQHSSFGEAERPDGSCLPMLDN